MGKFPHSHISYHFSSKVIDSTLSDSKWTVVTDISLSDLDVLIKFVFKIHCLKNANYNLRIKITRKKNIEKLHLKLGKMLLLRLQF